MTASGLRREVARSRWTHSQKKAVEGAVNMIRSRTGPGIPAVELIEMPTLLTTCFDEDGREYEITIKVPPKRAEAAA